MGAFLNSDVMDGVSMLNSIKFENFRGFDNIEFSEMRPITIIGGKNNAGKSSVLEGLFLAFDHLAFDSFQKINRFRGLPIVNDPRYLWEPLFYNLDTSKPITLTFNTDGVTQELSYSRDDSFIPPNDAMLSADVMNQFVFSAKSAYTLKFNYTKNDYSEEGHFVIGGNPGVLRNMRTSLENNLPEPMPPMTFINPIIIRSGEGMVAEWISRMELQGNKSDIVESLSIMDPPIEDVKVIAANGLIHIYAKTNDQLLPLGLVGDGLNKLLFIILSIVESPNSIILIDEIETGFHYSSYVSIWKAVAKAAQKYHCQVIATTHSYECISSALTGIGDENLGEDLCYFRIDRDDTGCHARRYSDEILRVAINADMEVR